MRLDGTCGPMHAGESVRRSCARMPGSRRDTARKQAFQPNRQSACGMRNVRRRIPRRTRPAPFGQGARPSGNTQKVSCRSRCVRSVLYATVQRESCRATCRTVCARRCRLVLSCLHDGGTPEGFRRSFDSLPLLVRSRLLLPGGAGAFHPSPGPSSLPDGTSAWWGVNRPNRPGCHRTPIIQQDGASLQESAVPYSSVFVTSRHHDFRRIIGGSPPRYGFNPAIKQTHPSRASISAASSAAFAVMNDWSRPSIMTRTSGSVPEGRMSTRPSPWNVSSSSRHFAAMTLSSR